MFFNVAIGHVGGKLYMATRDRKEWCRAYLKAGSETTDLANPVSETLSEYDTMCYIWTEFHHTYRTRLGK